LNQPVAVILGVVTGLIAFACNILIPRIPPKDDTEKRFVYSFAGLGISILIAGIALSIVWLNFEPSFVWFGLALCVTYIISLIVQSVQSVKQLKGSMGKQ